MGGVYPLARRALFRLPPERAHAVALMGGRVACTIPGLMPRLARAATQGDERLAVDAFGLRFDGPLGLAAGLDKDADAPSLWWAMGLSFLELGTVTPRPQPGNPRPRVHRLKADHAIVNAMGFPSMGADAVARRLHALRARGAWPATPIALNLGKNRDTPLEGAADDYAAAAHVLARYADLFVINVSSPNTPGLRGLQDETHLASLLTAVREAAPGVPALVKLAPDLENEALHALVQHAEGAGAAGIVAVNTTIDRSSLSRDPGLQGGLSGRPLARRALQALRVVRKATHLPVVSVGGIHDEDEALRRIEAGTDFLQLYTGLIYEGPALPRRILARIRSELDAKGASSLQALRKQDA